MTLAPDVILAIDPTSTLTTFINLQHCPPFHDNEIKKNPQILLKNPDFNLLGSSPFPGIPATSLFS